MFNGNEYSVLVIGIIGELRGVLASDRDGRSNLEVDSSVWCSCISIGNKFNV